MPEHTMTLRFDLHMHSTASDGSLSPTALVQRCAEQGVEMMALTDHDTLDGLAEAQQEAARQGIAFVPGVELSVRWQKRELHMLGLWVDTQHPRLQALIDSQHQARVERARKMGRKLDKVAGLANTYERAVALSGQDSPGRPWFARVLVNEKRVRNMQHAFSRYLKQGQSAFVATDWVTLEDAVAVVSEAGGLASIAHPVRYGLTRRKLRQLLSDFVECGGQALESLMPGLTVHQQQLLAECHRDFPLLASGGSDFHTPEQTWVRLGEVPAPTETVTPVWQHPAAQAACA